MQRTVTAILVWVIWSGQTKITVGILVQGAEITRDIGPSPDVLAREADHTSSLEIVHLAVCLVLYNYIYWPVLCMPTIFL